MKSKKIQGPPISGQPNPFQKMPTEKTPSLADTAESTTLNENKQGLISSQDQFQEGSTTERDALLGNTGQSQTFSPSQTSGGKTLSAEMMLRHMGWSEAADLIVKGMEGAISAGTVTYDLERLMDGATLLKCSEFGQAAVAHMA